jgi:hypothetical protein
MNSRRTLFPSQWRLCQLDLEFRFEGPISRQPAFASVIESKQLLSKSPYRVFVGLRQHSADFLLENSGIVCYGHGCSESLKQRTIDVEHIIYIPLRQLMIQCYDLGIGQSREAPTATESGRIRYGRKFAVTWFE